MYSAMPSDAIAHHPGPPVLVPWVEGTVQAGFPSPAADFCERRLDFNDLLILHDLATFMWESRGLSMVDFGIGDGDILVCDRALKPARGEVVIAEVDGNFTVKQFWTENGIPQLRSGNPAFPSIIFKDGQVMSICGVVTWVLKRMRGQSVCAR